MSKRSGVFIWIIVLGNLIVISCVNLAAVTAIAGYLIFANWDPLLSVLGPKPVAVMTATQMPGPLPLLEIEVIGVSRQDTFVYLGQPLEPVNPVTSEFLVTEVAFNEGITLDDVTWFEDGGLHGPRVIDKDGYRYDLQMGIPKDREDGRMGMVLIFVVDKNARGFVLHVASDKIEMDLSQAPVLPTGTPEPGK